MPSPVINSEVESAVKQVSSATVKFSNDKTSVLKDALQYFKDGPGKRSEADFTKLLQVLETVKQDKSSLPYIQHIEAIAAVLPAFAVKFLPAEVNAKDHLAACKDSAQYYSMKVLKQAKEQSDECGVEWAASLNKLLDSLNSLVMTDAKSAVAAPVAAPAAAVVNKEEEKEEEKPHEASIKEEEPIIENSTPSEDSNASDNLIQIEGNRLYIRKATKVAEPIIVKPESFGQAVALEDCNQIAVKIDGKITAVVLDKCRKTDIEVEDVVTNVEVLGCANCKVFLRGHATTVVLDDSEGVQVYLLGSSRASTILTSKCTEINVLFESGAGGEDEELMEHAIPAQFKTIVTDDGQLSTEPAQHAGN